MWEAGLTRWETSLKIPFFNHLSIDISWMNEFHGITALEIISYSKALEKNKFFWHDSVYVIQEAHTHTYEGHTISSDNDPIKQNIFL